MQRRILKYFILFASVVLACNSILAEEYSWKPILESRWNANSKYISDVDKEKKSAEEDEIRAAHLEVREGLLSMYKSSMNTEKYRKKPSEQYYNFANSEKYNNLLQSMLGFVKGKEKRNKMLDKSTIDGLEILRRGNFIDKICLYFDLDKLEEDKETYGEEEAVRRYTEDISLDKLFFLAKILNYQRDNHALVENRQILELLCEDCEVMENLFQNLQEMKQAQEFLLLFNDQISFLNQCGFSDIDFEDCLNNFGYVDNENFKKIIEYGLDTSFREYKNINFCENRRRDSKIYTWGTLDWLNPWAYIGWYFRRNKQLHVLFNVLHVKKILFSIILTLIVKFIVKQSEYKTEITDTVMLITLFDFIFRFLPNIKYPFLFSLVSGLLTSFIKELSALFTFLVTNGIFLIAKFLRLGKSGFEDDDIKENNQDNFSDYDTSCAKDRKKKQDAMYNPPIAPVRNNINQVQGEVLQQRSYFDIIWTFISALSVEVILGFLKETVVKCFWGICNFIGENYQIILLGLFCLIVFIALVFFYNIDQGYDNVLFSYVCKNLKQRTLYNARKYVNNMRSFYNTIKDNPSLYSKLKRRLKACYLLFDENAKGKLTEKQRFIFEMLEMNDEDITNEEVVKFFALFDEDVKSIFKKAIGEIYDVSTYVNSAHLVSTKRYCIARFIKGDSNYIRMKSMLHPYLTVAGIKNNVELGEKSRYKYRNMLFTGSNRSGKTTFIAAVALNVLLAHVFGIAFCEECILTPFDKIIAIFNYETDINDQQSKFSNEIKILRQLLSYLDENKDLKILFASDEQFSSTDPETANYLMSCFISSIYLQKNITSLNSTHLALPRKLAVLFQDSLGVCNVSLKTVIEENGNINFKRTLINRNGIMIGEQLARNMGFFEHLDSNFVKTLKNIKY